MAVAKGEVYFDLIRKVEYASHMKRLNLSFLETVILVGMLEQYGFHADWLAIDAIRNKIKQLAGQKNGKSVNRVAIRSLRQSVRVYEVGLRYFFSPICSDALNLSYYIDSESTDFWGFNLQEIVNGLVRKGMCRINNDGCIKIPKSVCRKYLEAYGCASDEDTDLSASEKMEKDSRQFVYVVEKSGMHKIGRSRNVRDRVMALQIGMPGEIKIIKSFRVRDAVGVEGHLHRVYKHKCVTGEWFNLDSKDVSEIDQHVESVDAEAVCVPFGGEE